MTIKLIPVLLAITLVTSTAGTGFGQTRIMPVGDSITQGGQGFSSYRYPLYFDLLADGFDIDFVGPRDFLNGSDIPDATTYPDYLTTFDRDHLAFWGQRTDEVGLVVRAAARDFQPEIVLIHLGTNDIGENGAAGVVAAEGNLRDIIADIRLEAPQASFLLARVIPIGLGSIYGSNADQVGPLNAAIDAVAAAMDTPESPVSIVDPHAGFSLTTMMQDDELHPNELGEQHLANVWNASLSGLLPPGNPAPTVAIIEPPAGGTLIGVEEIEIVAEANDVDGSVTEVRFFEGGRFLGSDTTAPYAFSWTPVEPGTYTLRAEAEDDGGAVRLSTPVAITVLAAGAPVPIAVVNPSFESPPLADAVVRSQSGVIGGWTFTGTPNTFLGIFNPPAGSYPSAAGQGTPEGADGAQVAFLFNDGGPDESVQARQVLDEVLEPGRSYALTVAIGNFDPDQPYSPSTYGGYRIELLAGDTVIAADADTQAPPVRTFRDAMALATARDIPPELYGLPLSIRLGITATEEDRSTHFDDVRLSWTSETGGNAAPTVAITEPRAETTFVDPPSIEIAAEANDVDGTVSEVRFFEGERFLGSDTTAPYAFSWTPVEPGTYTLRAEAEDDGGAVRLSAPVAITVLAAGAPVPIAVVNPSFESPPLADAVVRSQSGVIGGWTFTGTPNTFLGIFNPPAGSYPSAAGQGTPEGADGAQVAFLFNDGGPDESVQARQVLDEVLEPGRSYALTVAIGNFDPDQPYSPSTYGGYRIELLAGDTVIAADADTQAPPVRTFRDAMALATARDIPPELYGLPLSIRLGITATEEDRSTHFDDVRLSWTSETGGNAAPTVAITEPRAEATFVDPPSIEIAAEANDVDGTVSEVRFFEGERFLGSDTTAPYAFSWTPVEPGTYTLRAEAEDDGGAVRLSTPVAITVLAAGAPVPIAVVNPSFESPPLADAVVRSQSGVIGGWTFTGTPNTFLGIFNPPAGSYPSAAGQGTPEGADGAQVAFLFNDGGPDESVQARQVLDEVLEPGRSYALTVAIGNFDPDQPYSPSTYGGYRIELLAGDTVIAADADTQAPPVRTFRDAMALAAARDIPPELYGLPLSIRLGITATEEDRSTHFDDVRLSWTPEAGGDP